MIFPACPDVFSERKCLWLYVSRLCQLKKRKGCKKYVLWEKLSISWAREYIEIYVCRAIYNKEKRKEAWHLKRVLWQKDSHNGDFFYISIVRLKLLHIKYSKSWFSILFWLVFHSIIKTFYFFQFLLFIYFSRLFFLKGFKQNEIKTMRNRLVLLNLYR